jgi:RNA-binding protein 8A
MSGKSKRKGRGHQPRQAAEDMDGRGGMYDASESGTGPLKSEEGWVIFIRGVHEEAQEEDILDAFADFGEVRNINVNLDRHTGFVKGYALVEFKEYEEAGEAIKEMNGKKLLDQTISVDWAFLKSSGR